MMSCQKKEEKLSPRCIYDQPVFANVFLLAVNDEDKFLHFKQNPFFNLLWENLTLEEGKIWFQQMKKRCPIAFEKLQTLHECDAIGSPRIYSFDEMGSFSPSTLRLVSIAGDIRQAAGDLSELHLVQIGADCGSLCKIIHDFFGFKTFTLIDLPEPLALAKKCLKKWGVENVIFLTLDEIPLDLPCDLVISDQSFSEFDRTYQRVFLDRIFSHSRSGYLLGHIFPKHYGVIAWNAEELKEKLKGLGNFSEWQMKEPTVDREDYFIYWKRSPSK